MRRLHKAFLRYHDPDNWPVLREALRQMGRADLIGNGKHQLVPAYQPTGTGNAPEGRRAAGGGGRAGSSAQAPPAVSRRGRATAVPNSTHGPSPDAARSAPGREKQSAPDTAGTSVICGQGMTAEPCA